MSTLETALSLFGIVAWLALLCGAAIIGPPPPGKGL